MVGFLEETISWSLKRANQWNRASLESLELELRHQFNCVLGCQLSTYSLMRKLFVERKILISSIQEPSGRLRLYIGGRQLAWNVWGSAFDLYKKKGGWGGREGGEGNEGRKSKKFLTISALIKLPMFSWNTTFVVQEIFSWLLKLIFHS